MTDWYTVLGDTPETQQAAQQRVEAAWVNAPTSDLELCELILSTAREQVIAYAPAPPPVVDGEPAPPLPARYAYAQLQQAQNLWTAGRVSSDGDYGGDGYTFTPRPLDKTIKTIIRPIDGKPHVF